MANDIKAQFKNLARDYEGNTEITFTCEQGGYEWLTALKDKDLRLTVKIWKEKRSLDANAYYWVLLGKLAEKLKQTTAYLHNENLRALGKLEMIDEQIIQILLPDTDEAYKYADQRTDIHLMATSNVISQYNEDADTVDRSRVWLVLRGSHTFDTQEFSQLLDELIFRCKEEDIETMTPEELARMEGYISDYGI